MIIEIFIIFLQSIIRLQCNEPTLEEIRSLRQRQANRRSVAPPLTRYPAIRRTHERLNVPLSRYPSRNYNQMTLETSSRRNQSPGAFLVGDRGQQQYLHEPQDSNINYPILEVEATEIPIVIAQPIPLIARLFNLISRYNQADPAQIEAEGDDEDIPVINLYAPQEKEPIQAQSIRFQI
jgi:hypothetical protein